ncbi:tRNA methyltransferase complex GCD14 subunit-domain-containing protein [Mycena crocata]|nr:tRNA methyltransferase complex GCD14 subunit-domain-containing protein [Mycena crocata]
MAASSHVKTGFGQIEILARWPSGLNFEYTDQSKIRTKRRQTPLLTPHIFFFAHRGGISIQLLHLQHVQRIILCCGPSLHSSAMWSTAREIAAGDTVIIWLTREVIQHLVVTPGKDFNSKFGNNRHSDFIGVQYGSKVGSRSGKGFIHVLRPTPELWTLALPHRTHILYIADISFITSYLVDIRRGSRVIEAGTGSGSFSHSVARSIGASGHLWSYEFHEARAKKAREEFAQHRMSDIVTLTHRNVCKDGFTAVSKTIENSHFRVQFG